MMSGTKVVYIATFAAVCVISAFARDNGCGPLRVGNWGILAGMGAAPAFFNDRGYIQAVDPRLALRCPLSLGAGVTSLTCNNVYKLLNAGPDVFMQDFCKAPKFNEQFSNRVLHVSGQISYNVGCNTQYFLEIVYDRSRGSCFARSFNYVRAPDFAAVNCSTSDCTIESGGCSTSTDCTVIGTPLFASGPTTIRFSNYQAYGGYLGVRYYLNRMWCDRVSFFTGFKVGMLRRKSICAAELVPQRTATIDNDSRDYIFAAQLSTFTPYCASNALSGGVQIGADCRLNKHWSVLAGVELAVTAPFKSNRNVPLAVQTPNDISLLGYGNNFSQITNLIIAPTGTFIQFPMWIGIRWEVDWCK